MYERGYTDAIKDVAKVTDECLIECFTWVSDHNGRHCCRVLRENGVAPSTTCSGRSTIKNGKVVLSNTCGEPCSFVCEDAQAFSIEVERIKQYSVLISRAIQRLS